MLRSRMDGRRNKASLWVKALEKIAMEVDEGWD
jgi:hypothetical protein